MSKELLETNSHVWRMVVSLPEQDAIINGYTERQKWETTLNAVMPQVLRDMKLTNAKWVAAFHREKGHPHVHLVIWEKKKTKIKAVIPQQIIERIKKSFNREMNRELVLEIMQRRSHYLNEGKEQMTEINKEVITRYKEDLGLQRSVIARKLTNEEFNKVRETITNIRNVLPEGKVDFKQLDANILNIIYKETEKLIELPQLKAIHQEYVQALQDVTELKKYTPDFKQRYIKDQKYNFITSMSSNIIKYAIAERKIEKQLENESKKASYEKQLVYGMVTKIFNNFFASIERERNKHMRKLKRQKEFTRRNYERDNLRDNER